VNFTKGGLHKDTSRETRAAGKGYNPAWEGIFTLMRRERRAPGLGQHAVSAVGLALLAFACVTSWSAPAILFANGIIHTASNGTITNGAVLVESNQIIGVYDPARGEAPPAPSPDTTVINLNGEQLYPGLIDLDSALGLTEIEAVRATDDLNEVGDFTPDVESWVAVNPDSELLPVARANGIAYFEPVPQGNLVAGQSALLAMDGWTWEQMLVKSPVALHIFWPDLSLDTTPKERLPATAKVKSLADQDKERRKKLAALQRFLDDARAYDRVQSSGHPGETVPAWEAMRPALRGQVPVVIHAGELRQIKSAVNWAATNHLRMVLAGGMDAWRVAALLGSNNITVVYEQEFTQPVRDFEPLDVHYTAPEVLRRAGVRVIFSPGGSAFEAAIARNLPYHAAQAIAFGYPEEEALKGLTLYPAQLLGLENRLGSIEPGRDATLFICDGSVFDIRCNVQRMWIAGREISLQSRHTRLYDKYRNRPR
jgi:imidazolonepropionase-like amidohydrolase